MDRVKTLFFDGPRSSAAADVTGTWETEMREWDEILNKHSRPKAQIIFSPRKPKIRGTQDRLPDHVLGELEIPPFLLQRIYRESNGFSGCKPVHGEDGKLLSYSHWSRFVIKQAHNHLQPKRTFVRHNPTVDLEKNRASNSNQNSAIHDSHTIAYGWHWDEMDFFIHWTATDVIILCCDLPEDLQRAIESSLTSRTEGIEWSNPYSLFAVVFYEVLILYNTSVWSIRDHVCKWEAEKRDEANYGQLHEIARHAIHVKETLAVASESVGYLQQQHDDFATRHAPATTGSSVKPQNPFLFPQQILHNLMWRSESNSARIQNEIMLAFHTAAQRDSKTQLDMQVQMQKETAVMKAIAFLTMTFLPATLVSSVFSMPFFHAEPGEGLIVSGHFWVFWVWAVPLSLLGIAGAVVCAGRSDSGFVFAPWRKKDKGMRSGKQD